MNRLRQFWHAAHKVFDLLRRLRTVRDRRADPRVPTFAVNATLFLGALLRKPSFLQLQFESARRGWQRLIAHAATITDDRMVYVCERYRLEDWRAVLVGNGDTAFAGKELARDALRTSGDFLDRSHFHDFAAANTGAGAKIDDVVASPNRLLIVFDHDDGIANVAQLFQRPQQPLVVAWMQANRRFIEDVQDTDQATTNLAGQPNSLRLASR